MDGFFEFIIGVTGIITLIVFFIMSANIKKIKKNFNVVLSVMQYKYKDLEPWKTYKCPYCKKVFQGRLEFCPNCNKENKWGDL